MNPRLEALWKAKRKRVVLKRRRTRRHIPRPERGALDLVLYLQENLITTTTKLKKVRRGDDPMVSDYIKTFGSWSEAVKQAWPNRVKRMEPPSSPFWIVDVMVTLDIRTRDQYLQKRRELPELVPSYNQFRKHFRTFGEALEQAAMKNSEIALGKYFVLWNKLGRRPDHKDLKKWKVSLEPLKPVFATKRELDSFVDMLE